jgi:hypothetical protein
MEKAVAIHAMTRMGRMEKARICLFRVSLMYTSAGNGSTSPAMHVLM